MEEKIPNESSEERLVSPEKPEEAELEYERWKRPNKSAPETFDIKFDESLIVSGYQQLVEMYKKIEPKEYRHQPIGNNLRSVLLLMGASGLMEKNIDSYISVTRQLLFFEKSSEKIRNLEKWQERLGQLDQERHELHLEIKKSFEEILADAIAHKRQDEENNLPLNEDKVSFLVELVIGTRIGNANIWITRLLPEEYVEVILPKKGVEVHEFNYISDYHDQGYPYKQVLLYFNPLKYSRSDIKYEVKIAYRPISEPSRWSR